MKDFLVNLLIGIIGGMYSSVIVSRVFLLREELEEQLNVLRENTYYFGILMAFFEVTEMILKLQSDTSEEIEEEMKRDPEYCNTHDLVRVSDIIKTMKVKMLDKTVNDICSKGSPLVLKQKQFIELKNETEKTVLKYKDIKQFKFQIIDESKKEIRELEQKYEACISKRNRFLFGQIVKDKVLIALCVLLIVLCISVLFIK